jgi:fluoride exporter
MFHNRYRCFHLRNGDLLLVEQGDALKAILYVALSVVLGFVAAFFGAYIARNL